MATEKTADRSADDVFAEINAGILSRVFSVYPNAHSVAIVAKGPDGDAVIPVPVGFTPDDFESRIVEALNKLRPGEWMKGAALAAMLEVDRNNGNFNRILRELRKKNVIESNQNLGYRLTQMK